MPRCSKCKEVKGDAEFSPNHNHSNGLRSECKPCAAAAVKVWREKNRYKCLAAKKAFRESHKEELAAAIKEWRCRNAEHVKEYSARWQSENSERYKESKRQWNERNKEHNAAMQLSRRRREMGLTEKDLEDLFDRQGGACAICNAPLTANTHLDHCHLTGRVRGFLCSACNLGLGKFKDDVAALHQAILYIWNPPFQELLQERSS